MTFKINDLTTITQTNNFNYIFSMLKQISLLLPTMLVYMVTLDIFVMLTNLVIYPILFLFMLTPWRRKVYEMNEKIQNKVFSFLIGMTSMDVDGFKCQRTIL